MERENVVASGEGGVLQHLHRLADLVHAGQEAQQVPGLGQGERFLAHRGDFFPDGSLHRRAAATVVDLRAIGAVEGFDRESPAAGFQHFCRGEVVCQAACFEGGGHHQHPQVGAGGFLEVEAAAEGDIDGQAAFVEFVKNHRSDTGEGRVLLQPALEDAVGQVDQPGVTAVFRIEAHRVADLAAERRATQLGDPAGEQARGHPPRLDDQDPALDARIHQHSRHGGRLAGAGRGFQQHAVALAAGNGGLQGFLDLMNRQSHAPC